MQKKSKSVIMSVIRKTVVIIIILQCASGSVSLQAGLKDFSDESKQAESNKKKKSSSSSSSSDDDGLAGACMEIVFEVLFYFWYSANTSMAYAPYPYCNSASKDNFISYEKIISDEEKDTLIENGTVSKAEIDTPKFKGLPENSRPWFYSFSAGYHWAGDDVKCGFASLRGRFYKLIGPEFEARQYRDKDGKLSYFIAALNIPIMQHDYFSPDFYAGWGGFRGMLDKNGLALGVTLTVYPVRPVVLYGKLGMVDFDSIRYRDYEGRIGLIFNRYEVFGGYRTLYSKAISTKLHGFETGIRLWL
jgi:hypothetical protein